MDEIPDPVFSEGVLGQCCGIEPVEGKVYAPVDGKVTQVADSKHALGFAGPGEVEILIHVGVDTVEMNGDGFSPQIKVGDTVKKGQLAGIPTEASILGMIDKALPGKVLNCYAHRSGGGKYMAILQCRKTVHTDEGKQRQAALLAFSAFPELKHLILVDEDVDIFDSSDVLWALNTRFQGNRDIITIPGVRCHPLDPSSNPAYTGSIRDVGISTKTIFDCTVPFELKDHFKRAPFLELDPDRWLHG